MIRITTGTGTLEIEPLDADVQVLILRNGELVRVLDRKTNHTVELLAGDYRVKLGTGADDWRLSTNSFTLRRGETALVNVTWQPTKSTSNEAASLVTRGDSAGSSVNTLTEDAPRPDAEGWYSLFNGKDLTGWRPALENPNTFQVVDGEIVAHGPRCHLFYVGPLSNANFKNFDWKCEILTKHGANSGMFFHTKYQPTGAPQTGVEVQIDNTHRDPRKTGSIYRIKDIMNVSPAQDEKWFTQEVIVKDSHITVKIDGRVVNEYGWPKDLVRETGWEGNVLASGTFALQGHDPQSEVHFRKILVKPLP